MCLTEGTTGTDVVNALTAQGVNAPIILCCSKINYREQTYPENVIFLYKQNGRRWKTYKHSAGSDASHIGKDLIIAWKGLIQKGC